MQKEEFQVSFSDNISTEYEEEANRKLAMICRLSIILLVAVGVLNLLHVFIIDDVIYPVLAVSVVIMFLPTVFYNILKRKERAIRYFVMTLVVLMSGILYTFLSYHVIIMLVFPLVISCLYCDKKSVWFTTILGIPVMVVSHLLAYSLKVVPDEPLVTLRGTLLYGVLPRVLEYIAIAAVCISMTGKLQNLINVLVKKNDELYLDQESLITSLSQMIESQSQETGQHVKRVSEYTKVLCRSLEMSEDEIWKVGLAAMMHDVGKIFVPHDILEKPGKLTADEFAVIKKHTLYGKRMLEQSPGELMQISAQIAYEHHERYDGKGYAGMKGDEISMYSRCVSIADVFDALVSWRPYKEPWTTEEARAEIIANGGSQFDPILVEIFDEHFEEFQAIFEKYPDSQDAVDTEQLFSD